MTLPAGLYEALITCNVAEALELLQNLDAESRELTEETPAVLADHLHALVKALEHVPATRVPPPP